MRRERPAAVRARRRRQAEADRYSKAAAVLFGSLNAFGVFVSIIGAFLVHPGAGLFVAGVWWVLYFRTLAQRRAYTIAKAAADLAVANRVAGHQAGRATAASSRGEPN